MLLGFRIIEAEAEAEQTVLTFKLGIELVNFLLELLVESVNLLLVHSNELLIGLIYFLRKGLRIGQAFADSNLAALYTCIIFLVIIVCSSYRSTHSPITEKRGEER